MRKEYKRIGLGLARGEHTRPIFDSRCLFFGVFGDGDNFFTLVIAAVRADVMRHIHLVTVGTFREILRLEREMAPAAVTASFGQFPFWKRGHVTPCRR